MRRFAVSVILLVFIIPAIASAAERTYAACTSEDKAELLYKPRSCYFGFGASFQNANLISMRWSGWRTTTARGKGKLTRSMGYGPIAIAVTLSRPKYCPEQDVTIFSRVGTKTRYGGSRDGVRMAICADLDPLG